MSPANPRRILAIGGAHIDRRGRMTADFTPGASIPGAMREDVGGGAFNAVRMAVRRGAVATLMSVRGGDGAGLRVAEAVAAEGIHDVSAVFLDRATPSYTALLDKHGDVVAALADMELYDLAFPKQMRRSKIREELLRADALLADANLPAGALERLAVAARGMPFFAVAISPAKVVRMANVLPALDCLFMNRREAMAIIARDATGVRNAADLALELSRRGLRRGVVSEGASSVMLFDAGKMWTIEPPAARSVVDVTGAGDALAGAAIAALLSGAALCEAVRDGIAAAMLAIGSERAVPAFTQDAFLTALDLVPQAVEMR